MKERVYVANKKSEVHIIYITYWSKDHYLVKIGEQIQKYCMIYNTVSHFKTYRRPISRMDKANGTDNLYFTCKLINNLLFISLILLFISSY